MQLGLTPIRLALNTVPLAHHALTEFWDVIRNGFGELFSDLAASHGLIASFLEISSDLAVFSQPDIISFQDFF